MFHKRSEPSSVNRPQRRHGAALRLAIVSALFITQTVLPAAASAQATSGGGSLVGVWTSALGGADVAHLDELGAAWAHPNAVWSAIQPLSADQYDWFAFDQEIVAASAGGRRHILVTVRGNPVWAAGSRCKVTTEAERGRLADFAAALARRYSDKIPDGRLAGSVANVTAWQFYNEPDNTSEAFDTAYDLGGCFGTRDGTTATQDGRDAYAKMLERVGSAVHLASPSARVVSGGVVSGSWTDMAGPNCLVESSCIFDRGFLPGVLSTLVNDNALDRLDEVAVHFYSSQGGEFADVGPDLVGRIAHLRQDMLSAGLTADQLKPIIVDEGSYTGGPAGESFVVAQRDYVPRVLSRAAYAGVDAYFWFWLRDAGSGLGSDVTYGLVDRAGNKKPAYQALRYFTSLVNRSAQLVGSVTGVGMGLEGYQFALADGRHVQIVWNLVDVAPAGYTPTAPVLAVTDPIGVAVAPTDDGQIAVGAEPRFIFLAAPSIDPEVGAG